MRYGRRKERGREQQRKQKQATQTPPPPPPNIRDIMRANGEQSLRVAKGRRREAEGGEESGRIITAWKYDGGKKERGRMGERDGGSFFFSSRMEEEAAR